MEVTHTKEGMKMLGIFGIMPRKTRMEYGKISACKMNEIKNALGDRKVFLLVSGGVDSTVAYALLSKPWGQIVFTGFL